MTDDFEDHCWKDIVTPDVLDIYDCYRRKVFVGSAPALLAIDLYEVVYAGGAQSPASVANMRNPESTAKPNPIQAQGSSTSASSEAFRPRAAIPRIRKSTIAIDPMHQKKVR